MRSKILLVVAGLASSCDLLPWLLPDGGIDIPQPPGVCRRGGCSGELCTDRADLDSICIWEPRFACFQNATCERQPDGECGFTPTPALRQCLGIDAGTPVIRDAGVIVRDGGAIVRDAGVIVRDAGVIVRDGGAIVRDGGAIVRDAGVIVRDGGAGPCFRGGCSSEICSDTPGQVSTCIYRPEYICYQRAMCERQPTGQCGFTPTPAMAACLGSFAQDAGQVQCLALPSCDPGDQEIDPALCTHLNASCYERTLCGTTITCVAAP